MKIKRFIALAVSAILSRACFVDLMFIALPPGSCAHLKEEQLFLEASML
jgi:hypothetical protein